MTIIEALELVYKTADEAIPFDIDLENLTECCEFSNKMQALDKVFDLIQLLKGDSK